MAVGILIGARLFPARWQKYNAFFQTLCTAVLIFAMGVSLGSRPQFLQEMREIGLHSLLFALLPMICSTALVYLLTQLFLQQKK